MFCVFYLDEVFDDLVPRNDMFDDMSKALKWCNTLRNRGVRFVTMASEVDGNCTKMGVSSPDEKYDWKKRRI